MVLNSVGLAEVTYEVSVGGEEFQSASRASVSGRDGRTSPGDDP